MSLLIIKKRKITLYYNLTLSQMLRPIVLLTILLILNACYVHQPKYATLENANKVNIGMTSTEVSETLQLPAYDFIKKDSLGNYTNVYKYRLMDSKRIPMLMKKNKGIPSEGAFKNLLVTFNIDNKVIDINTTYETIETDLRQKKVNFTAIVTSVTTLITVTIPAVLIYISNK